MLDTLAPGEHDGPAMKYKTLFRLLLKLLGVCFLVEGGSFSVVLGAAMAVSWLESGMLGSPGVPLPWLLAYLAQMGIGLYLFLGAEWIVNRAIPGNRPYCPECAYDLSGAAGGRCPECGTPFRPEDVRPADRSE